MTELKSLYQFTLRGTVCGNVRASTPREAMSLWAANDLFTRSVIYGRDTVTVNGVTYRCEAVDLTM